MNLTAFSKFASVMAILPLLAGCPQTTAMGDSLSPEDLDNWSFHGIGEKSIEGDIFNFSETEHSKGVMLVSPAPVPGNVVVSCEMRANTPDTVIVIVLAFSDAGKDLELTVPADYDGAVDWLFETENYFFAFRNEPHKRKPFLRKNPSSNRTDVLAEIDANVMGHGEWKSVEAGVKDGRAWLRIGGDLLFEVPDPAPLKGGFLSFRIRGTATGLAGCSIRNLSVMHP